MRFVERVSLHSRNQKVFPLPVVALVLALLVLSCEIEDEIRIHRDGTGTYRAKILVEKQFASALPEARKEAVQDGFRIVEEGETETRHFIVMERDFKNISEVGDSRNRMSFAAAKAGWLRERYEFSATLPSSSGQGFSRQLTIVLPGRVERNTAGELRGNSVVWDCTKGGTLEMTSVGFVLPSVLQSPAMPGIVVAAVALGIVLLLLVRRRRSAAGLHCAACGVIRGSDARFCANCGRADALPATEESGG